MLFIISFSIFDKFFKSYIIAVGCPIFFISSLLVTIYMVSYQHGVLFLIYIFCHLIMLRLYINDNIVQFLFLFSFFHIFLMLQHLQFFLIFVLMVFWRLEYYQYSIRHIHLNIFLMDNGRLDDNIGNRNNPLPSILGFIFCSISSAFVFQ